MDDEAAIHKEIGHLRTLAALNTDARVLAELEAMIQALLRRLRRSGNGRTVPPPNGGTRPADVWWRPA